MAHSSEMRWAQASGQVSRAAETILNELTSAESVYQDLLEVYNYSGGNDQVMADLLFTDDIANRLVPGTQAVITVDVTAGVVSNPIVTEAGSGYANGTGLTLTLVSTAGGGNGAAELTYDVVNGSITNVVVSNGGATYTDGTGVDVSDVPAPVVQVPDTVANAAEVAKITDLRLAITALHELYGAMTNVVTPTEDRATPLRRMS